MLGVANKRPHVVEKHSTARRSIVERLSPASATSRASFLHCRYPSAASFQTDSRQHVFPDAACRRVA
jgi:hypothetical protein